MKVASVLKPIGLLGRRRIAPFESQIAFARVGTAFAALSVGALAVGALAVGSLAIGRLAVGKAKFKHVHIGELEVDHLRVKQLTRVEPLSSGSKDEQ